MGLTKMFKGWSPAPRTRFCINICAEKSKEQHIQILEFKQIYFHFQPQLKQSHLICIAMYFPYNSEGNAYYSQVIKK